MKSAFMTAVLMAAAAAAQAQQSVEVPAPLQSIQDEIAAQGASVEDAAAIAERRRLNAEIMARNAATDAAHAAATADYRAKLRAHEAAAAEAARARTDYDAARAIYDQRQKEIADWQACQDGDRKRCPPKPAK